MSNEAKRSVNMVAKRGDLSDDMPSTDSLRIYNFELLTNVHTTLPQPCPGEIIAARGNYSYFHYGCDAMPDVGWGCGYRTLQTICSFIIRKLRRSITRPTPTIGEIQQVLVDIDDSKSADFLNSKSWIGSVEASYVLEELFDVASRILHKPKGKPFTEDDIQTFVSYFRDYGGICMMGGDVDAAAKGIVGVHVGERDKNDVHLLIVDPHYPKRPKSAHELIEQGYVRWEHVNTFDKSSFYNVCMPLIKS